MAEEENTDEVDLGEKLEKLVEEIKEVMERRKERIAELRAEIDRIEQDNVGLENTMGDLLKGFYIIIKVYYSLSIISSALSSGPGK